jgi:uncharacterized phiE125 gp8 family phage protein
MASLGTAKQHLRVDTDDEDSLITLYVSAATAWVENYTGKKLTRAAVEEEVACFTTYLPLRWGPDPAALTIDYTDTDDAAQEITDASIVGSRAYPAESWPSIAENTPITLTYTAGYSSVPDDLDAAVLLLTGHWYANRETVNVGNITSELPFTVEALCRPHRGQLV